MKKSQFGLLSAIGLFTIFPVPPVEINHRQAIRSIRWIPAVGLLLGFLASSLVILLGKLHAPPIFISSAGIGLLALLTGGLHLDGVADTADGLGSRKSANEALAIMRKSDIGPIGVIALVFFLLLEVSVLILPIWQLAAILLIGPVVGRFCCLLACGSWLPSARETGFGATFAHTVPNLVALIWSITIIIFSGLIGWIYFTVTGAVIFISATLIAVFCAILLAKYFVFRLSGLTGDTFGALIESSSLIFYLVSSISLHFIGL